MSALQVNEVLHEMVVGPAREVHAPRSVFVLVHLQTGLLGYG